MGIWAHGYEELKELFLFLLLIHLFVYLFGRTCNVGWCGGLYKRCKFVCVLNNEFDYFLFLFSYNLLRQVAGPGFFMHDCLVICNLRLFVQGSNGELSSLIYIFFLHLRFICSLNFTLCYPFLLFLRSSTPISSWSENSRDG